MAVRKQLRPWLLAVGLCIGAACRNVSLCADGSECKAGAHAGGGGENLGGVAGSGAAGGAPKGGGDEGGKGGDADSGGNAGGGNSSSGRNGGSGGHAASSGNPGSELAGAGGQGGGDSPDCDVGSAECDGSRLTYCETPTAFSFRHCGGCGRRCDGACVSSTCKESEELLRAGVTRFVTNASAGFLLVDGVDDAEPIYYVELATGALELLVEGFDTDVDQFLRPVVVLGSDRLYRRTRSGQVMSVELDGEGLQTEPFTPASLGATSHGVYYTSTASSIEGVDVCSLWFRAAGESTFRALLQSDECSILSSSRSALALERHTETGTEVVLVKGDVLVPLGPAPAEPRDVLVVGDDVVFLLDSEQSPSGYELLWLTPDPGPEPSRTSIEIVHDVVEPGGGALVLAPRGVALTLGEGAHTFVQTYTRDGADGLRIGMPNSSSLLHVDAHIWYVWYPTQDSLPRLRRARQLELPDLRPEE